MLETLERLAPGTALRQGFERIMQHGKGAIVVIGNGPEIDALSSGGFHLQKAKFSPARLGELSKMDGGIVLDEKGETILAANVHFVPSIQIPTEETGSRHRTAQRIALQTSRPVVAVSEGRKVATLYLGSGKVELQSPTEVSARVNQELQTLERLRRRLDEAEAVLTHLEVASLTTYRAVVTLIQRAELVRRVGRRIDRSVVALGAEGRLASIQLADMVRGVRHLREIVLRDYLPPRRLRSLTTILEKVSLMDDDDLDDPIKVAKVLGFGDLDDPASARGFRILSNVGRLPDSVREELVRHFGGVDKMLKATADDFAKVEGIGSTRANHLRNYFARLFSSAESWAPQSL